MNSLSTRYLVKRVEHYVPRQKWTFSLAGGSNPKYTINDIHDCIDQHIKLNFKKLGDFLNFVFHIKVNDQVALGIYRHIDFFMN